MLILKGKDCLIDLFSDRLNFVLFDVSFRLDKCNIIDIHLELLSVKIGNTLGFLQYWQQIDNLGTVKLAKLGLNFKTKLIL